jgi:hypothetical protein
MEDEEQKRAHLLSICTEVVNDPEYAQKADGSTLCNIGLKRIAADLGCVVKGMANEIIDSISQSSDWRKDTGERAFEHAEKGGLAIAGIKENPHGHVVAIVPLTMQFSGSWNKYVPMCAHVGKAPNGIKRVSKAFRTEPEYFLWKVEEV